jgi:hypothetical protein
LSIEVGIWVVLIVGAVGAYFIGGWFFIVYLSAIPVIVGALLVKPLFDKSKKTKDENQ